MTQKIFDIDNAEDMALLWSILPDDIIKVEVGCGEIILITDNGIHYHIGNFIAINWHNKTEITRPVQEATEADIGKLCMFWDYEDMPHYGVLRKIDEESIYKDGVNLWRHCRRLTKQEIEELC